MPFDVLQFWPLFKFSLDGDTDEVGCSLFALGHDRSASSRLAIGYGGDGGGSLSQKSVTQRQRVEAARMEATSTKEASNAASTDEPRPGLVTTSHT